MDPASFSRSLSTLILHAVKRWASSYCHYHRLWNVFKKKSLEFLWKCNLFLLWPALCLLGVYICMHLYIYTHAQNLWALQWKILYNLALRLFETSSSEKYSYLMHLCLECKAIECLWQVQIHQIGAVCLESLFRWENTVDGLGMSTNVKSTRRNNVHLQDIDEMIAQARNQSYTALLRLGSRGITYASQVVVKTALMVGTQYAFFNK